MIRFFRAFLWLRWRMMVNALRAGGDRASRFARWSQVIVTVLLPLLFVPVALGLSGAALLGGRYLGSGPDQPGFVVIPARIALAVVTVLVVLAPLMRSIHGSATGRARFLLLPIPRGALHLCETVAGLGDPWIFILVPSLATLALGWLSTGDVAGAGLALAAGAAFLLTITVVAALAAFLAHLLFRNRRRAELISLVLLTLVTVVSFVPVLMDTVWDERREGETQEEFKKRSDETWSNAGRRLGRATWFLPSELYARALSDAEAGRSPAAWARVGGLALMGLGLFTVSARVHRRLVETPAVSSSRRGAGETLTLRPYRIPGLGAPASAVAWASIRPALRTVRGKLAVYTNPLGVGFLALVLTRQWEGTEFLGLSIGPATVIALIALIFPLLSWQPVLLNCYAIDRAGLSLEFLAPLSDRDIVRGKMTAGILMSTGLMTLCLLAGALITRQGPLALWVLAAVGGIAAYVLLAPVFAILSAVLPKTADLASLGKAGNPNQLAAFSSLFVFQAGLAPTPILGLAGHRLTGTLWAGVGLLLVWLLIAALLAIPLALLATKLLGRRREGLALTAQGR